MRLFTLRGPVLRVPWPLVILGWASRGLWHGTKWLAVHTAVAATVALALLVWWTADRIGWPWLALATGCLCIGLGAVMELQPQWWRRVATAWVSHRRLVWYRARWEAAMVGAGLTLADDVPQLLAHRFGGQPGERDLDVLTVQTVPGQVLEDWRHVQPRLAAAWGCTRVRVHGGRNMERMTAPFTVDLFCAHRPAADRRSVAGAQVPATVTLEQAGSTAVDEPVDGLPPGAFPRTPRPGQ